jgi:hypothetical protein
VVGEHNCLYYSKLESDEQHEAAYRHCAKHDGPIGHLGCDCAPCPVCR